ncbi:hypothetical protein J7W08_04830 [Methanococcoides orientis]|nr:hypothetical protein [Methanococcoides orientis]UGV41614.1 hypothetical protein J7W08_04830 [Methanococcoides orientis]
MRSKVTTQIDADIKLLFDSTKKVHGKSYSEVLENGIQEMLREIKPI